MKKILVALLFFMAIAQGIAQQTITVNGEQLEVVSEVDGTLSLYLNKTSGNYRYFVSKNNVFYELVNTKDANGNYAYEYKATLKELTADATLDTSINRTSLTLTGLRKVVVAYNQQQDSTYSYENKHFKTGLMIGILGGVTNNIYTTNPENEMVPQVLAELEVFNALKPESGHAAVAYLNHTFEGDTYTYTSTNLSLNYRYKVINKSCFKLYGQVKLAALTYAKSSGTYTIEGETIAYSEDGTDFDFPIAFGIGADFRVFKNTFLTLQYLDAVSVAYDSNGEFPANIAMGIKFML